MLILTFLLISFVTFCDGRDAWKYFLEKKKIQNCTFVVLTNKDSDVVWIEYSYSFQNKINITSEPITHFTVGLFENFEFDCKFSNGFAGYSVEIFKFLEHLEFSYILIYDPSKLRPTKDIFILTFAGTLWICFVILMLILAACLHLSTKQYSFLDEKYVPWSWVDITLWTTASACQQGLSHTPNGFASRLIFFLGYVISYLLYTGFAAGITSLLLQQVMNKEITASDVEEMNVKIVMIQNFEYLIDSFQNNTIIVSTIENVFNNINKDDVVAIVPKLLAEQYYAKKPNYFLNYAASTLTSSKYSKSFLMHRNSSYRVINSKLMRLREIGLLAKALKDSILPLPSDDTIAKHSSAGIEHVGSAIAFLVVGAVASTIFLVLELIFALYNGKLQTIKI